MILREFELPEKSGAQLASTQVSHWHKISLRGEQRLMEDVVGMMMSKQALSKSIRTARLDNFPGSLDAVSVQMLCT